MAATKGDHHMAKSGIKVRTLARELGVTSRQILDRCRAEGVPVQNSITRLSPELERTIRAWFGETKTDRKSMLP